MAVDFTKQAHILTVHGVQTSEDKKIDSDDQIRKLVTKSLDQNHLQRDFAVSGFFYEDINDKAQQFYKLIAGAIAGGNKLTAKAVKTVVDLVGDVVTAAGNTSTAKQIRQKLVAQILDSYNNGHQLVLVSHSLGTIYALDVVCELMQQPGLFDGDDMTTWPVQGLVTMGSPLGLEIDLPGLKIFEKRTIQPVRNASFEVFPWHNFYNRLDPIVSGNVFGVPVEIKGSKGPVEKRYGDDTMAAHWRLQGHAVTSGAQWLLAHTAYWKNPKIGDRIIDMLWG